MSEAAGYEKSALRSITGLSVQYHKSLRYRSANSDGCQQNRDVVVAAVAVGSDDQGLAGVGERRLNGWNRDGGEDACDLAIVDVVGKPVGGEQVEVAGLGMMALHLGFDSGLGADGAGDEVTHGRAGCLSGSDLSGAELLFYKGVVAGELLQMAATEAVTAAVADMREPEGVGVPGRRKQRDQRGSHAGELRATARLLVDSLVGGAYGGGKAGFRLGCAVAADGGLGDSSEEGFGCEAAGDFAGGGSAHAVADDEGSGLGRGGAGILVAAANEARVREHGVDERVCRHGWE